MTAHPEGFRIASDFGEPPAAPLPEAGELIALVAEVEVAPARLAAFRATFSPREELRFQSFATDELRSRWGGSRGFLREALGAALGLSPADVAFGYGPHGKPVLHASQQPARAPLHFNLSHSGGLALLVLARGVEVGADIELPRARRTTDLTRRWYTAAEQERVFAERDPADAFFRLWTCKEAFLKATGEGLSRSLRSYEVELHGDSARLVHAEGIPDAARRYSMFPLRPGEPYRAAAVAEAQGLTLLRYRWPAS